MTTATPAQLALPDGLAAGSHVSWVVDSSDDYVTTALGILAGAARMGEKAVAFGPAGTADLTAVAAGANQAGDPRQRALGADRLDPEAMFAMFHSEAANARAEGYRGLRVVADMDWLLPCRPAPDEVIRFELLLDREAKSLGATIVCAYRSASFAPQLVTGLASVHPISVGCDCPQFRLVADDHAGRWRLSGEVDLAVATQFAVGISSAAAPPLPCTVDVSELEFIDVAGLEAIARAGHVTAIRLVGARPTLRRIWKLAGFDEAAPLVTLHP